MSFRILWDLPSLQVKQFLKKALTNGSSSSRRSSEVIYTICKGWSYSPPLDYKMYEMYERLTGANTIAANLTHRFSGKMKLSHHDGVSDSQHHQPTCVVSAQSGIQDQPFSPGLLFLLSPCCHRGASSSNSLHTLISFWTGKPTSGTFWGISRKIHHKHQIWCSWNKGPK